MVLGATQIDVVGYLANEFELDIRVGYDVIILDISKVYIEGTYKLYLLRLL